MSIRYTYQEDKVLYAFFDLAVCPVTFDITNFLCLVDTQRVAMGLDAFKVIFVPGHKDGFRDERLHSNDVQLYRLYNLHVPALQIHPNCIGYSILNDREDGAPILKWAGERVCPAGYTLEYPIAFYNWRTTWKHVRDGDYIQTLQARPEARALARDWLDRTAPGKRVVTITFRESWYQTDRNNNVEEWAAFIQTLDRDLYEPVLLRDHEASFLDLPEALKGVKTCNAGTWSLQFRVALYECAYVNMFVNNGPWMLAVFDHGINKIAVKIVTETVDVTSSEWRQRQGDILGEKYSFLGPHQEMVWQDDDAGVLIEAFRNYADTVDPILETHFDADWYLGQYPDARAQLERGEIGSAFDHYLAHVKSERVNPNAEFDEADYLNKYPGVVDDVEYGVFASGYDHYLKVGPLPEPVGLVHAGKPRAGDSRWSLGRLLGRGGQR